jgi:hypothetical protein
MKRVIVSAILLFGITTMVSAQKTGSQSSKNKKTAKPSMIKVDDDSLNNRQIYNWSNGQTATPTGEDATSSNGSGYSAIKKDSTKAKRKGKQ